MMFLDDFSRLEPVSTSVQSVRFSSLKKRQMVLESSFQTAQAEKYAPSYNALRAFLEVITVMTLKGKKFAL